MRTSRQTLTSLIGSFTSVAARVEDVMCLLPEHEPMRLAATLGHRLIHSRIVTLRVDSFLDRTRFRRGHTSRARVTRPFRHQRIHRCESCAGIGNPGRLGPNPCDTDAKRTKIVPDRPKVSPTVPIEPGKVISLTAGNEVVSPAESACVPQSPKLEESAPCRNRTCNPVIKSHLLCQLS